MTYPGGSNDLIGDFQRWLLRSGARGMSRELADQVRAALGKNQSTGDVWETATTQPVVVAVLSSTTTALTKPGTFLAALSSTDFTVAP